MTLRDHFRPPVEKRHSWDELHGGWPMVIVQTLFPRLPEGYVAAPGVHLGAAFEIDVSAYEQDKPGVAPKPEVGGGVGGGAQRRPQPTLTIETELPDQDEYEVRIYEERHGRRLVAAIELISPANKDRPQSRRRSLGRLRPCCNGMCACRWWTSSRYGLQLYAEVLNSSAATPALGSKPPGLYAVTMRGRKRPGQRSVLESWFYPMQVGQRVANAADLAGRGPEHRPGTGVQLRGNLPLPAHFLSGRERGQNWHAERAGVETTPGTRREAVKRLIDMASGGWRRGSRSDS